MGFSLRWAILLVVIVGLLIPAALISTLTFSQRETTLAEGLRADQRRLLDTLTQGMQQPLWRVDPSLGDALLRASMADGRVVSITVLDDHKRPFLSAQQNQRRSGRQFTESATVLFDRRPVGTVTLQMDSGRLDADVAHERQVLLLTVCGQLLFSLLLIFVLLQARLLAPIRRLMDESVRLARRELAQPFQWTRKDELGALGSSLELTRQALQGLFDELEARNRELNADVARRIVVEQELQRYRDHLEELVKARTAALDASNQQLEVEIGERRHAEIVLQRQTEALQRSNAELEQLAYVASHDLQEPLRMVGSYLQLLERRYKDRLDEDAHDFIGFAVDGAQRMQALINDLLSYSRVGTRPHPVEPVDCNALMDVVLRTLRVAIEESGATVQYSELPTLPADASQLTQLLQNLVGNAIKFRGETPPVVQVSAERQGDNWQFAVRDNGIGIAPEYFERIFVLFQRLHGRRSYAGTGIGLAICKKIVERHGGRIWVESQPGAGTTFRFTLPVEAGETP